MKSTLIPLAILATMNSCAWYRDLERSMVDEKGTSSRTVSRAQYDQLLLKYEELSKKYEELKEKPAGSQDSLVDELQRSQTENFAKTSSNVETVDVFPSGESSSSASPAIEVPADVEAQLILYRKGIALKESNQGEATKIFQQLESKAINPVKVRSKFQIGDMLLKQGQYDLALQTFEDIISKNADSGVVLDALNGAVIASEKLGMISKKDQYASMLKDVFGTM